MNNEYLTSYEQPEPIDPRRATQILEYLEHHLPTYPFDSQTDAHFVEELLRDFPDLDLLEELKAFRWYYDDAPISRVKKPRVVIRRWMANARPRNYT